MPDTRNEQLVFGTIEFTQYMRPDGRAVPAMIDRPSEIAEAAQRLKSAGYRLETEVLITGEVSMTVEDADEDKPPIAIEVCPNGPEVLGMVDKLILGAAAAVEALKGE